jgi:hypothetical protein
MVLPTPSAKGLVVTFTTNVMAARDTTRILKEVATRKRYRIGIDM